MLVDGKRRQYLGEPSGVRMHEREDEERWERVQIDHYKEKRKGGRDGQRSDEVRGERGGWKRRQMGGREGGGGGGGPGCSQMALMTNDIPCLRVPSPQHHDLSSPLLTFFIALSNHPDRMIFSNSPGLGARRGEKNGLRMLCRLFLCFAVALLFSRPPSGVNIRWFFNNEYAAQQINCRRDLTAGNLLLRFIQAEARGAVVSRRCTATFVGLVVLHMRWNQYIFILFNKKTKLVLYLTPRNARYCDYCVLKWLISATWLLLYYIFLDAWNDLLNSRCCSSSFCGGACDHRLSNPFSFSMLGELGRVPTCWAFDFSSVSASIVRLNINEDNVISAMTHLSHNPGHGTANEFMANSISAGDHYHFSLQAYKEMGISLTPSVTASLDPCDNKTIFKT